MFRPLERSKLREFDPWKHEGSRCRPRKARMAFRFSSLWQTGNYCKRGKPSTCPQGNLGPSPSPQDYHGNIKPCGKCGDPLVESWPQINSKHSFHSPGWYRETNCKRNLTFVNTSDFSDFSVVRQVCATRKNSTTRSSHNFVRMYPFETIRKPLESPDSQLFNGFRMVKNGSILQKLWPN